MLTRSDIERAIAIAERIQRLEEELEGVMGGNGRAASKGSAPAPAKRGPGRPRKNPSAATAPAATPAKRGRKPFSAATKARMAAAQRARWAGKNVDAAKASPAKGGKRTMSSEVRARLAAAMKARWAAAKKKGLPGPNARK
jgi:hypothetical protein